MNQQVTTFNVTPCSPISGGKLPIDYTIKGNEKKRKQKRKQKRKKKEKEMEIHFRLRSKGPGRGAAPGS